MTILVGVDIQEIGEVRESMEIFGDRHIRRTYTDYEIDDCFGHANGAAGAPSSRFAAEKAMFEILTTAHPWSSWREGEVRRLQSGHPSNALRGAAAEQAARQGISTISLSLSQSGGTATAVVVAESTTGSIDR